MAIDPSIEQISPPASAPSVDKKRTVKGMSAFSKWMIGGLMGGALSVVGGGVYVCHSMKPDTTSVLKEDPLNKLKPREYFDNAADGDILGRELTYVDEKGKEYTATFFVGSKGLAIKIDGRIVSCSETFKDPELAASFGFKPEVIDIALGVEKSGDRLVFKLRIRDSHVSVPASILAELGACLKKDPNANSVNISIPYSLEGKIKVALSVIALLRHTPTQGDYSPRLDVKAAGN